MAFQSGTIELIFFLYYVIAFSISIAQVVMESKYKDAEIGPLRKMFHKNLVFVTFINTIRGIDLWGKALYGKHGWLVVTSIENFSITLLLSCIFSMAYQNAKVAACAENLASERGPKCARYFNTIGTGSLFLVGITDIIMEWTFVSHNFSRSSIPAFFFFFWLTLWEIALLINLSITVSKLIKIFGNLVIQLKDTTPNPKRNFRTNIKRALKNNSKSKNHNEKCSNKAQDHAYEQFQKIIRTLQRFRFIFSAIMFVNITFDMISLCVLTFRNIHHPISATEKYSHVRGWSFQSVDNNLSLVTNALLVGLLTHYAWIPCSCLNWIQTSNTDIALTCSKQEKEKISLNEKVIEAKKSKNEVQVDQDSERFDIQEIPKKIFLTVPNATIQPNIATIGAKSAPNMCMKYKPLLSYGTDDEQIGNDPINDSRRIPVSWLLQHDMLCSVIKKGHNNPNWRTW